MALFQPVIIIGSGPTGLMMACELHHQGVPFRIIDKNEAPTATSNATWLQPRSLELLDLLGIANRFAKLGHHCHGLYLHSGAKREIHLSIDNIDSTYSYFLMLPQSETERLLIEYLTDAGIRIERYLELIDIHEKNDTIIATIRHHDGKVENITSHWLIACDGANSGVRAKLNIPFSGATLAEQFIVADAQMDSYVANNEAHIFFDKKTVLTVFPLGSNKYRIGANLHQSHPRKFFIEKEIREMVHDRCHGLYDVHAVTWISPFWIHGKLIKNMRQSRVFFVGDAAHIYSPIVAEGMNAGFQDAANLAWKLALVINGKAYQEILDTYHLERFPIAKEKVCESDELAKMALLDKNFPVKLREFKDKITNLGAAGLSKLCNHIAQLTIQYLKSPIIHYLKKDSKKKLKPGMRAPDVSLNKKTRLYQYFRHPGHDILLFTGITSDEKSCSNLKKIERRVHRLFPGLFKVHYVCLTPLKNTENIIHDADGLIHARYHVKSPAIFIIRPDNYIAYYSKKLNRKSIFDFLRSYLVSVAK